MANAASSYVLQDVVDVALTNGDTAPALATGGFSQLPALQIANMVMQAILLGGPGGQPCNWKFNRFNVTPFPTISWQQDYFVPGIVTLGWLESAWGIQYTNSSQPKPKFALEVKRDLMVTFQETGYPGRFAKCLIVCCKRAFGAIRNCRLPRDKTIRTRRSIHKPDHFS